MILPVFAGISGSYKTTWITAYSLNIFNSDTTFALRSGKAVLCLSSYFRPSLRLALGQSSALLILLLQAQPSSCARTKQRFAYPLISGTAFVLRSDKAALCLSSYFRHSLRLALGQSSALLILLLQAQPSSCARTKQCFAYPRSCHCNCSRKRTTSPIMVKVGA